MIKLNSILNFLILASFCYSISIINHDEFNIISDKSCDSNLVYEDCPEHINQIHNFKNNVQYLRTEKIYLSKDPEVGDDFKNIFTISKNGEKFYFPPIILDKNNSISKSYSLSKGDTILAYHLFNKVLLAELLNEIVKYELIYQKPRKNSNGYDIELTSSDYEIIKREFSWKGNKKIQKDYSFNHFIKQLNDIIEDKNYDAFPCKKITSVDDDKFVLEKLSIRTGIIQTDKILDTVYKKERAVWYRYPDDFGKGQWTQFLNQNYDNEYTTKQILEILTYWININTNALFEDYKKSVTIKDNEIIQPKKLWIIELFNNRS